MHLRNTEAGEPANEASQRPSSKVPKPRKHLASHRLRRQEIDPAPLLAPENSFWQLHWCNGVSHYFSDCIHEVMRPVPVGGSKVWSREGSSLVPETFHRCGMTKGPSFKTSPSFGEDAMLWDRVGPRIPHS